MTYPMFSPDKSGVLVLRGGSPLYIPISQANKNDIASAVEWVMPENPSPSEEEIRKERDALLASSDWTQVADAPVDQAAWATYRQALRDIPAQMGFPENVVWPTQP